MNEDYTDIINLPHHVSQKHPPMPLADRAAQFAPFSALTGLDDSIQQADDRWIATLDGNDETEPE